MMELDIKFEEYKRIFDEFTNYKIRGYSGYPHYVDNGNSYVVYFSTPEFTYRCVVSKRDLSKVDEMQYIKAGIAVSGRVVNTIVREIKPSEPEAEAEQASESVGDKK